MKAILTTEHRQQLDDLVAQVIYVIRKDLYLDEDPFFKDPAAPTIVEEYRYAQALEDLTEQAKTYIINKLKTI